MNKTEIAKSLKRLLKRKTAYTVSLLVSFLITGGVSFGGTEVLSSSEIATSKKVFLEKIQREKKEILQLLEKNKETLSELEKGQYDLIEEADFYSKPLFDSTTFSLIGNFSEGKSAKKNENRGNVGKTSMDSKRDLFSGSTGSYASSGWITNSPNYTVNTTTYDYESRLIVLPVVKIPEISLPTTPQITSPTAPNINPISVSIGQISPINVTVNPATVGNITTPTVNIPGINVVVGELDLDVQGPTAIPEIGTVSGITVSFTPPTGINPEPPTLSVNPVVPPSLERPDPEIPIITSPIAPDFTAFSRGRGYFLGGRDFINGFQNFNRKIVPFDGGHNATNGAPLFAVSGDIYGQGKENSASGIFAMTDKNGNIRNEILNIASSTGSSGARIPVNPQYNNTEGYPIITADQYYSYKDLGPDGNSPAINNLYQQQSWVFQGSPHVRDVQIKIGGSTIGQSTNLFSQNNKIEMTNVKVDLLGYTMIGQLLIQDGYEIKLTNVDINVSGDNNTLFGTVVFPDMHGYWTTSDIRKYDIVGAGKSDLAKSSTYYSLNGLKSNIKTSQNTIVYIDNSKDNRWFGYNIVADSLLPDSPPGAVSEKYDINPKEYYTFSPLMGNIKVENPNGKIEYTGSKNVGIWINGYVPDRTKWVNGIGTDSVVPSLDLGEVTLHGDRNIAYYFAENRSSASKNGVFQGNINANIIIGTSLKDQDNLNGATGNLTGNSPLKSEDNVGIYVASGQRVEMNNSMNGFKQYFPATLDFKIPGVSNGIAGNNEIAGIDNGTQIGFPYLNADPINSLKIPNFKIQFGQFSEKSIGLIAKNGTVVEVGGTSIISDNAISGAKNNTLFYSEGVWFNPRKEMNKSAIGNISTIYDSEAYGRGESVTGQKNIIDFNSKIIINSDVVLGSESSIALFAKDGGHIKGKNITLNGKASTGVFISGENDFLSNSTSKGDGTGVGSQATTIIELQNIVAMTKGKFTDEISGEDSISNNNTGAIAITQIEKEGVLIKGTGGSKVNITGKVDINGLGAFARGNKAEVNINGSGSAINTGTLGSLVALDGGKIKFGGGTINHKETSAGSHDTSFVFFADGTDSNINFTGATTMNISNGVVFYGENTDFDGGTGSTIAKYSNMGNVTVNLMENGINLGLFKDTNLTWDGTTTYLDGIKLIPKVAAINDNGKWYKSSLDGGTLLLSTNVDLGNKSLGDTIGDKFNDIAMERVVLTVGAGHTVSSVEGKTLAMGSNKRDGVATTNLESGYIVDGDVNIKNTSGANTGIYTSFGQITLNSTGKVTVDKGVGVYGVNGSKITNDGTITVESSTSSTSGGIGIVALSRKIDPAGNLDTYGTDAGEIGKSIEVINNGDINLYEAGGSGVKSNNAIGIYADNNTGVSNLNATILNKGKIELGNSSTGILLKNGGTLTLESKDVAATSDIKVGQNSFGIVAEKSDTILNTDYKIELGGDSIGIYAEKGGTLTGAGTLKIAYNHTTPGESATGLYFKGVAGESYTNAINIDSTSTSTDGKVLGIYGVGADTSTSLTNSGTLNAIDNSIGIYGKTISLTNTGTISATGENSAGIYLEDGNLTNTSDITVTGKATIGIYGKGTAPIVSNLTIGTGTVTVGDLTTADSNGGVGIYAEGSTLLNNSSNIDLADSTIVTVGTEKKGSKNAIYLKESTEANTTSGIINVGKDNIGIYAEKSNIENAGTLNINHDETGTQNIGIYAKDKFEISNTGTINVSGVSNIGIALLGDGTANILNLSSGTIDVTSTSMLDGNISIGVSAKGNNITINSTGSTTNVTANAVGINLDGTSIVEGIHNINIASDVSGKLGIGMYLINGAKATNGTLVLNSTTTSTDANGKLVRPVGIFYGTGSTENNMNLQMNGVNEAIGLYGESLTFINTGKIDIALNGIGAYFKDSSLTNSGDISILDKGYGLYLTGAGTSTTSSTIGALGLGSIGAIVTNGASLSNTGTGVINSGISTTGTTTGSIGVYSTDATFDNQGTINAKGIGIYGKASVGKTNTTTNTGNISTSEEIAIYGEGVGNTINNTGTIELMSGSGIISKEGKIISTGAITSSTVTGGHSTLGIVGQNGAEITSSGDITLGNLSTGIVLNNTTGNTTRSKLKITAGDITIGNGAVGIYANNGDVDTSIYTGTLKLGDKSTGIYLEKGSTVTSGTVKVDYTSAGTDKGVGLYLNTNGVTTSNVEITTSSSDLIHIYAKDTDLINNGNQEIQTNGIGIYATKDIIGSTINNNATLTLTGANSFGIYLAGGAILENIGTIVGSSSINDKIGVYIEDGDIIGNSVYNFGVDGGVGIYTKKQISYAGTLNVSGNAHTVAGTDYRTVGILYEGATTLGNLNTNINLTGTDSVGILLDNSKVTYNGTMDITATSSAKYGIGSYLKNSSEITLGATGVVKIGGTGNIGFYVEAGSTLNIAGGRVENTPDGILAYLDGGIMNFASGTTPNIDYVNVIVEAGGSITNNTTINVGSRGLQGIGSTITNNGVINSSVLDGKALVGIAGSILTNSGTINLTGKGSVGIYTAGTGTTGVSTGNVTVGEDSTAYYAKDDSIMAVSGNTTIGENSTMFTVENGKINYTGTSNISVGNKQTVAYITGAAGTVDFGSKSLILGTDSTGIVLKNGATFANLAGIMAGDRSMGLYGQYTSGGPNTINSSVGITIGASGIGIGGESIDIINNGLISSTSTAGMGISNIGATSVLNTGTVDNVGTINLTGDSSIGIYSKDTNIVKNSNVLNVLNGTSTATAVGIYGDTLTQIDNVGTITIGKEAVGIYGNNITGSIDNAGTIASNNAQKSTGIYGVNSTINNTGTISLGDGSNGIYSSGGDINHSGNITVGNAIITTPKNIGSTGIYGDNGSNINSTGSVVVGSESVGIASTNGNITVSNTGTISAGTGSTYIYTDSGKATNNSNLALSDYSIGMYSLSGTVENNAKITVGKSSIVGSAKISVGIATNSGLAHNTATGIVDVTQANGVGMLVGDGGIAWNDGIINVTGNQAYGIQGAKSGTGVINSRIYNSGTINVSGTQSRGIAGTNYTEIYNHGTINVSGTNTQGIYLEGGASLNNLGTIAVTGAGNTGIYVGAGSVIGNAGNVTISGGASASIDGSGTVANIGSITITGPTATIDGVTITNSGTITINGALDVGNISLGTVNGNVGTINADSLANGELIILPGVTQGSNKDMYIVQYLGGIINPTNNGNLSAISQSVSFIADIQLDAKDPNKSQIVLVKIPYVKLLENTNAVEFGKGLDEIYNQAKGFELDMFDALDKISNKEELAATFDNQLRGNVYANIQDRMMDLNNVFDTAYETLKAEKSPSRGNNKIGVIMSNSKIENNNMGIENYEYNALGTMYIRENDTLTYGKSLDYSLGFTGSEFKFDSGSEEKIYSLRAGIGYNQFIGNNSNLEYSFKSEIGLNYHEMERKISLSNGTYENKGDYFSGVVQLKNKLNYELVENYNYGISLFTKLDLGYGAFEGFNEKGDGILLDVKSEDYFSARPGVGISGEYKKYIGKGKLSLKAKVGYDYELSKVYDGGNSVKIAGTSAGTYNLEKPENLKGIFKVGVGIEYLTDSGIGLGVEVERYDATTEVMNYKVTASYQF